MSNDEQRKVPNLAKTVTDKIIDERRELEEERPSAPITMTPDGPKITAPAGSRVEFSEPVGYNDLAQASHITSDPNKLNLANDGRHITDGKIYMNSVEFNELRRFLYEHHRERFEAPIMPGISLGGAMVAAPFEFVMAMNNWLGMEVQFDTWNEAGICKQFLDHLRNKSAFDLMMLRDVPKLFRPN